LVSEERITERFAFIYPTEEYVKKSNLGVEGTDCLHLRSVVWSA